MQHHPIHETQIMEQNLHQLIKNQNYFSCFIQNSKHQQQPTNPFQKKLFDKNLRRSTISCGHYNSHQQNSTLQQSHRMSSSRRNSLVHHTQNLPYQNPPTLSSSNLYVQLISQPKIQTSQRVTLAQSRHSDPLKQQINQIINNFRLQLDYLEQKLHHKVDQLNTRYGDRECSEKDREGQFMIESLQKIVGFMVENCVNLQDSVMYGERSEEETGRSSEIMRKEVYQIEQDENEDQQNMSFINNNNTADQYKPTHRFKDRNVNAKDKASVKKRKIVGMMEKENMNSNNYNEEQNMPQTYYINSKLHTNNQNNKPTHQSTTTTNKPPKQTTRPLNQPSQKATKRALSKNSNQKPPQNNTHQNDTYHHYHSSKQSNTNQSYYNSNSQNDINHGAKSIYETVLEEREQRLKIMKKKMV